MRRLPLHPACVMLALVSTVLAPPAAAQTSATLVSGDYTCTGVTSKQAEGGMGKVDFKVRFTAKS
jgi:hypothetical protein